MQTAAIHKTASSFHMLTAGIHVRAWPAHVKAKSRYGSTCSQKDRPRSRYVQQPTG